MKRWVLGTVALMFVTSFLICQGAAAKETVTLGFIGPFTGGSAFEGVGARNCFELALKKANASGKYKYEYKAIFLDDESQPATGVSAALKLTSDPKVIAAAGHWNSSVAMATTKIFHQFKMALSIWCCGLEGITLQGFPEITRVGPTSYIENVWLGDFLVGKMKYKRWSIINDPTDYGIQNRDNWIEATKKNGGQILSQDTIPVGTQDFRPILTKIKELNPDGVYAGNTVTEAGLIKLQMSKMGINTVYGGTGGLYIDKFHELAPWPTSEGSFAASGGTSPEKLPWWPEFKKEYDADYKDPIGWYQLVAYDNATVLMTAIEKVGPDREKVVSEIRKTSFDGLSGKVAFDKNGQNVFSTVTICTAQDGKWVVWEDSLYAKGSRKLPPPKSK